MNAYVLTDSRTMLRRNLRRLRRYPSLTFFIAVIPVLLLLLFVYVFGATLGAGLAVSGIPTGPDAASIGREAYIAYIVPGILLMTAAGTGQGTAITVAMDMTAGIIARFRTMSIARGAVLAGHVLGSVIQTALATVIVVAVALARRIPADDRAAGLGRGRRALRLDVVRRELVVGRPGDGRARASRPPATPR